MALPPSKRRRLSEEPSNVNATRQDSHQPYPQSAPATPRRSHRASYLSPTKSSLQRSHPHLLQKSAKVSAHSHGQRLLEHVLNGATANNVETSQANTNADGTAVDHDPTAQPNDGSNSDTTRELSQPRTRSALQRRPQPASTVFDSLENEQSPVYSILPRLVKGSQSRRRQFSMSPDEPEVALPPTPVQLGREPAPERPRGLSSSSPGGSRSGSGRNRRRLRDSQPVSTSPLKPKSRKSRAYQKAKDDQEAQQSDNASESGSDDGVIEYDDVRDAGMPDVLRDKQTILKRFRSLTRRLQANTRSLESALVADDVARTLSKDAGFVDLIKAAGMARTLQEPLFDLKPTVPDASRQKLHLNLFAPGGLTVATKTSTRLVKEHVKIAHSVKVTAPPPWPPHMFSATFDMVTDPEDLKVERIISTDAKRGEGISNELYQWIKARLTNDIVRTDLAGLTWGIGTYFSAAVDRAKVFYSLQHKYGNDSTAHDPNLLLAARPGSTTIDQAAALSQYITDNSITLEIPLSDPATSSRRSTRQSYKTSPKILAVWNITLSPTSEVRHTCEVVLSCVSNAAGQAAVALFDQLWQVEGYERAFDAVWALLTVRGGEVAATDEVAMGRGTVDEAAKARKKRKRIA